MIPEPTMRTGPGGFRELTYTVDECAEIIADNKRLTAENERLAVALYSVTGKAAARIVDLENGEQLDDKFETSAEVTPV